MATHTEALGATHNRWLPVVGGVLLNMVLGTTYAWTSFVSPIEKEFGWTRLDTSIVFSIAILSIGSWFLVAGFVQDRVGPRPVAIVGALLYSLGFLLGSMTHSLMWLYVGFGAMIGAGNGWGYVTTIATGSKWFPDRRGLIVGLMVGGYGAASGLWGPVAVRLIDAIGWRATMRWYSLIFLVMGLVGSWLLTNPPAGYVPPGWSAEAQAKVAKTRSSRDIPPGEMLRTPTFYFLWVAYCLGCAAGLMVVSQLVQFGTRAGLTVAAASFALIPGAVGNAGGRILSGWISDAFGRLNTLRLMILVSAVAMPILYAWGGSQALFYLLVVIVYYCFGTQLSVFASTSADFYGTKHMGTNYGLLFLAWGVSGFVGPTIGGAFFDRFHDYRYAFYTASALSLIALASLYLARAPHESRPASVGAAAPPVNKRSSQT